MAEGVIDALEVVDIQEQGGQFLPVTPCCCSRPAQVVLEHRAVWESGQAVMVGDVTHLFMVVIQVLPHFPECCSQFANFIIGIYINRYEYLSPAHLAGSKAEFPDGRDELFLEDTKQKGCGYQDRGECNQGNRPSKIDALCQQPVFLVNNKCIEPVMQFYTPGNARLYLCNCPSMQGAAIGIQS